MNEILHEETLTTILVVGIFLAFIFLLIETRRSKSKGNLANKYRTISAFPGFISTLGVLGTFIGITKGLMFFDTNDLDNSIPKLLSGLKLAFITSLMGMIGSLILSRIINHLYDKQERESGQEDNALSALNKLVNVMKDSIDRQEKRAVKQEENTSAILHKIEEIHLGLLCSSEQQSDRMTRLTDIISDYTDSKNTFDQITVILDSIHQEVTGGSLSMRQLASLIQEETTIISKGLEQIENSIANSNELMGEKFGEFSELLKKSNTEALVEVMKRVTTEFQKQMNALIGKLIQENFSKLNDSVESLNTWQQENKSMISSLTEQYNEMADRFSTTSTTLSQVCSDTETMVGSGGKLHQIVVALNQVIVEDKHFIETSENLLSASKLTQENMENYSEATRKLNNWVTKQRNFVDAVQLLIEKLDEINKIKDYNESFWKDTKHSLEDGISILSTGSKTLEKELKSIDEYFYNRLNQTLVNLDACIQAMVRGK
ncbi:MotA/TolQ/ExbB proton channel family protein [Porphyromonas gulae]|uniref:MotA/TolQ/ExbB proton channel family protein n=1 Tax=Porphyromonas gulae TaxID=111105 RepID=UPI00052D1FF2|nr:MotA/TolQ/ExbB proton channel family protein [Porphyromonas gulae]KGO04268.1 hypothetical protein HR16_05510 [Porphyromonas gulae]